jgi:hypothetical protein
MPGHFIVSLKPDPSTDTDGIEGALDKTRNWFRIKNNLWVVVTTRDADRLFSLLQRFAKPDGQLFICGLEIENRQGWMSNEFWDWLRET